MKNYPLDFYEKWPFARKAVIFYKAASKLYEIKNRQVGSWEAAYYLLSHSIELSIKAIAWLKTGQEPARTHDKMDLAETYRNECDFSEADLAIIKELKDLNNGSGGLRYDNEIIGKAYPHTFVKGAAIVRRLLEKFEEEE